MKKILFPLLVLAFFFFGIKTANAGVVTYPTETNILLTTPNITLAVEANSSVDSVTVSDSNITVTVSAPDSFVLRSDNKYNLANNGNFGISCGTTSKLTIQPSSGTQTVIITPTTTICTVSTSTSSTSSNSNNSASAPSCGDTPPGAKAPWLYGATAQNGSVLLYFTEAANPVSKYVLEYGTKPGEYSHDVQDLGVNIRGHMTYLVKSLSPSTTYYFRVRGKNGCAAGFWSNEISATTRANIEINQLDFSSSQLETTPKEDLQPTAEVPGQGGYYVNIKVVDTAKRPVEGAVVTIHSNPQTTKTDKNGIASFEGVEAGNHKVLVAYNGFEGEQSINLTGDIKKFDLNITVQQKTISLSPLAYGIIGIMISVIIGLTVLLIRSKR